MPRRKPKLYQRVSGAPDFVMVRFAYADPLSECPTPEEMKVLYDEVFRPEIGIPIEVGSLQGLTQSCFDTTLDAVGQVPKNEKAYGGCEYAIQRFSQRERCETAIWAETKYDGFRSVPFFQVHTRVEMLMFALQNADPCGHILASPSADQDFQQKQTGLDSGPEEGARVSCITTARLLRHN